jgi:hypothetical protein
MKNLIITDNQDFHHPCMTVTNRPNRSEKGKQLLNFREERQGTVAVMSRKKNVGDRDSAAQKRALGHCRTQSVLQRRVEKQMRLSYESQVRSSTVQRYGKPQALGSN